MKKQYSKPEIMFESFLMSTNIAGDCGEIVNNHAEYSCPYVDRSGNKVFTEALAGICTDVTQADGANNSICYHTPSNDKELFNS